MQLPGTPVASLVEAKKVGVPVIAYGNFVNQIISFVIVAFAIFLIVKQVNRFRREEPAPPEPELSTQEKLLTEIRDALQKQNRQTPPCFKARRRLVSLISAGFGVLKNVHNSAVAACFLGIIKAMVGFGKQVIGQHADVAVTAFPIFVFRTRNIHGHAAHRNR